MDFELYGIYKYIKIFIFEVSIKKKKKTESVMEKNNINNNRLVFIGYLVWC